MLNIHPKAEPFFLEGKSDIALLFIHGFTASPSEIYPTAKIIHQMLDCNVSGILLPGHGTIPGELNKVTWQDWVSAVEKECRYLSGRYKKVFVAGLSMGGLLSLYAGIHIQGLNGIISINAPVFNNYPVLSAVAPIFQVFKPYFPKKITPHVLDLQKKGRFAYDCMPVKAFRRMGELRNRVVQDISLISVPLLVVQSKLDESVNPGSGSYIAEKALNASVQLVELQNSYHVATMGEERKKLAGEIVTFIDKA